MENQIAVTVEAPAQLAWPEIAQRNVQTLLKARTAQNTTIYGVMDSAADPTLYDRLMSEPTKSQVTCLFEGAPAIRYRDVAPYIFALNLDSPLSLAWLEQGWKQHWGIWLTSAQPISLLKAHLKKFLFVQTAHKEKAYFRFYDPRVMNKIMLILNPQQRGKFFGLNHKSVPEAIFTAGQPAGQLADHPAVLQRFTPKQSILMKMTHASDLQTDQWAWQ
jgi:Domain of unknown function (DUF4123)